jgi:hypothetical protein
MHLRGRRTRLVKAERPGELALACWPAGQVPPHGAVDVDLDETEDLRREPPTPMIHDSATTPVLTDAPTAMSPRDWFAGAGDDRDHSIRSWIAEESGHLRTVCGGLSAHQNGCEPKLGTRGRWTGQG